MKILMIGLPNKVDDALIIKATTSLVKELALEDYNIQAKVLQEADLAPIHKAVALTKSKFVIALEGVMKIVPNEATLDSIGFRSWFYSRVIDGTIAKPILEVLSFGPIGVNDQVTLKATGIQSLPEYAKVALNMIA